MNTPPTARYNPHPPNPAVEELQNVRVELEGIRNELIGLRADLRDKKTLNITDNVAKGVLLAGFALCVISFVFSLLVSVSRN